MAVLKVVKFPAPVLLKKAEPVGKVTAELRALVRDMIDTMYAQNGVGLAANQVGVPKRVFVASADQVRGNEGVYFNPEIVWREGRCKDFEGCLSVPELYEPVQRSKRVRLKALALDGSAIEVEADGLLARIFQHETDHLNGILFVDRLGFLKARSARRELLRRAGRA